MKVQFRPALTAATIAALAILCSLGSWQLQRLAWKNALIDKTEARLSAALMPLDEALAHANAGEDMEYQPVYADGAFRHERAALVFGAHDGMPGAFIFTPFDRPSGVIYVNRGFVAQDAAAAAAKSGPTEIVRIEGLFRRAEAKRGFERMFAPDDQPADNLFFARDPRALAAAKGFEAPGYYIDSFGRESAAAGPKGGLTRVAFSNRHFEYAMTWFGLAAALAGVYIAYSVRRG